MLVTLGPGNDPELLGAQPPHVHVERFVPQTQVLPAMDLVVTHGGAGTMLGAFACGLPLLVLPQGADQFANAERVVAAGAGLALTPAELSADAVASGAGALLSEARYREAARRIQSEIAAMPAPVRSGACARGAYGVNKRRPERTRAALIDAVNACADPTPNGARLPRQPQRALIATGV